jgi:hypothetical protein
VGRKILLTLHSGILPLDARTTKGGRRVQKTRNTLTKTVRTIFLSFRSMNAINSWTFIPRGEERLNLSQKIFLSILTWDHRNKHLPLSFMLVPRRPRYLDTGKRIS